MRGSTSRPETVGIFVDAGPGLGFGHAVRCVRLARHLSRFVEVVFFPLSDVCASFLRDAGMPIGDPGRKVPPVGITDLRRFGGVPAAIHRSGSRHVSIHDLGIAQCRSDVAIDGSVTTLFPYQQSRTVFQGPEYMLTQPPVERRPDPATVLLALGGGSTASITELAAREMRSMGIRVMATAGFLTTAHPLGAIQWLRTEDEIRAGLSRCTVAVTASGVSLYDALASGIPSIAVAFDCLQLRTAEAFRERGASLSAGLAGKLTPSRLASLVRELIDSSRTRSALSAAASRIVDGHGVDRVSEIVRRELCPTG